MKLCLKDVMMKVKENELIKDLREKQWKTKEAFGDNARKSKLYSDMKTLLIIKYQSIKKKYRKPRKSAPRSL